MRKTLYHNANTFACILNKTSFTVYLVFIIKYILQTNRPHAYAINEIARHKIKIKTSVQINCQFVINYRFMAHSLMWCVCVSDSKVLRYGYMVRRHLSQTVYWSLSIKRHSIKFIIQKHESINPYANTIIHNEQKMFYWKATIDQYEHSQLKHICFILLFVLSILPLILL